MSKKFFGKIVLKDGNYKKETLNKLKDKMIPSCQITIFCPYKNCDKKGDITIPQNVVNSNSGTTKIRIPEEIICEHAFMIYIDKNFVVRGTEKIDFDLNENEKIYENY